MTTKFELTRIINPVTGEKALVKRVTLADGFSGVPNDLKEMISDMKDLPRGRRKAMDGLLLITLVDVENIETESIRGKSCTTINNILADSHPTLTMWPGSKASISRYLDTLNIEYKPGDIK